MSNNPKGKTALVTGRTTDGRKSFTVTRSVFDTRQNSRGSWRTETVEHVRNIPCKECRQYMAFVEWEANFWRCPRCGVEN